MIDSPKPIKRVLSWHKNKQVGQWNRTESSEIDQHGHGQLIFNKNVKAIQWEKVSLFNK